MNLTRKVSTTTYPIVFMMVDSTDHVTGETGLTPTVTISKNGAGYAAAAGAVSEIGGGLYALAGNATDRGTLGELWIHADGGAGVDKSDFKVDITSHDPYGDIAEILTDTGTTIPDVLTAIKGIGWSDETLVALMAGIESGSVDEATIRTAIGLAIANLDTQLSGINTAVGNIYNDMADVNTVLVPLAVVDANVDAILEDTGTTIPGVLTAIKGAGWTDETLVSIQAAIEALSLGGVDPAVIAAAILDALLADHTVEGSVAKAIADILEDTGVALNDLVVAIKAKTDLMNASAVTFVPNVIGTTITLLRGDTFTAALPDAGVLVGYQSIDFTVKTRQSDKDDEAVVRIRKNASGVDDGLLRLNGKAPTTETGSITIDDEATGDITITLDETATANLSVNSYLYDIQLIRTTGVLTLTSGKLVVNPDITNAIA